MQVVTSRFVAQSWIPSILPSLNIQQFCTYYTQEVEKNMRQKIDFICNNRKEMAKKFNALSTCTMELGITR